MAAYWLFIVLMLATFTANLAALLTGNKQQIAVMAATVYCPNAGNIHSKPGRSSYR